MEYKDYYKIMGLERSAAQDEVKRAYRKLARKYHPDISKEADADERFKEVGEAYEVLKDPEKRAAYDQLGANWQAGQSFNTPPNWDAGFEFSGGGFTDADASTYSDFFESLFGRRFQTGGPRREHGFQGRGEDHHAKVVIDLEDTWQGAKRQITLQVPTLDEQGHVYTKQRTLNVNIPKGVKQGQHIRLAGQGTPGLSGGVAGDLYLQIEFKPHRFYRVDGSDLHIELPVAPWEAALGASVKVPTPKGIVELKIPPNSSNGRKLRLKDRGIPGRPNGDLYVDLSITLPAADSEKAKVFYQQMATELAFNPRADLEV